jgi:hypothetical protein
MRNDPSYSLQLQVQRRDAYHERCRVMRVHVLEELALQLRAHLAAAAHESRGVPTHLRPEMSR